MDRSLRRTHHNHTDLSSSNKSCFLLDRFPVFETEPLVVQYIINCSLNAILSVTAILGNVLILHALRKSPAIQRLPSRAFLFSLALSDLAVGFVVQPLYVIYKVAELNGIHRLYCIAGIGFHLSANVFSAVSFLTVVAIALDRVLALHLGAKYQTKVSQKLVTRVILFLWALTSLWVYTWLQSIRVYQVFNISVTGFCLFVALAAYIRLWLQLHKLKERTISRWKIETKGELKNAGALKLRNYRRSVMSMFYIYILLFVCYSPYLIMFIVIETSRVNYTKVAALSYALTILFANATFNPFLYCWRIGEIRDEVYVILSKCKLC